MLVRSIAIENVRSFLDRREMKVDGNISIIIGPNGGGKTNLLDTLATILKRYLFATRYAQETHHGDGRMFWVLQPNQNFASMTLEKHSQGMDRDQVVEIEVEVSTSDIENMRAMRDGASDLREALNRKGKVFQPNPWTEVALWKPDEFSAGMRFTYVWRNWAMVADLDEKAASFLRYMQLFEFDNSMRSEVGAAPLQLPMLYLPVHRASSSFVASVALPQFNEYEQRRSADVTTSRLNTSFTTFAIGRLASTYRLLQEVSNTDAKQQFRATKPLEELTEILQTLGYSWDLVATNALTNEFSIRLTKQGTSFLVDQASSGERELLTYLFAIYALNVRDALIVVDEPELHLHPRWQATLFNLFEKLARSTGNQFLLATHSPTFVSPSSIQYVSRVYSREQRSNIVRLNSAGLPNAKHLFNLVNSHNNERIFFTDKVVLVEGIHDRIVFEKLIEEAFAAAGESGKPALEVVSVGGKGAFAAYSTLLTACQVEYAIIADRDYVEQVGTASLKALFKLNSRDIKEDVVDNIKSIDGDTLVARIDEAMNSGSWDDAIAVWQYIKSRRRMLKPDLSEDEERQLDRFLALKAEEQVFILRQGTLEDYLPEGYRSKDTEKLIDFVAVGDLLERLPSSRREELDKIVHSLLGLKPRTASTGPATSSISPPVPNHA